MPRNWVASPQGITRALIRQTLLPDRTSWAILERHLVDLSYRQTTTAPAGLHSHSIWKQRTPAATLTSSGSLLRTAEPPIGISSSARVSRVRPPTTAFQSSVQLESSTSLQVRHSQG